MEALITRYVEAFFLLAKEKDKVIEYKEKFADLSLIFTANPTFCDLLSSRFLTIIEKKDAIKATINFVDEYIMNFIYVIIDNNRASSLLKIFKGMGERLNKELGIIAGYVYSVTALTPGQIKDLEKVISNKLKLEVVLTNRLEDSLLGGVKIAVGDYVFDGSVKSTVDSMKKSLLERN